MSCYVDIEDVKIYHEIFKKSLNLFIPHYDADNTKILFNCDVDAYI